MALVPPGRHLPEPHGERGCDRPLGPGLCPFPAVSSADSVLRMGTGWWGWAVGTTSSSLVSPSPRVREFWSHTPRGPGTHVCTDTRTHVFVYTLAHTLPTYRHIYGHRHRHARAPPRRHPRSRRQRHGHTLSLTRAPRCTDVCTRTSVFYTWTLTPINTQKHTPRAHMDTHINTSMQTQHTSMRSDTHIPSHLLHDEPRAATTAWAPR